MSKIKQKYFSTAILSFVLFCSSACSTIVGAYNDDPYGPVVNCDSELPMDKLLQCVDEKYAAMDSIYESPRVQNDRKYQLRDKVKNDYKELSFFYKKIPEFTSIKPCYNRDRCQVYSIKDGRGLTNYDEYEGIVLRVECVGRNIMGEAFYDTRNNTKIDKTLRGVGWVGAFGSTPNYFIRSYKNPYKDIIISNQASKVTLYVPLIELVKLNNEKTLIVATINRFCLGKQPEWWVGKVINNHFDSCGVYRFFYVTDKVNGRVSVDVSLDQRKNPKKIYLKIAKDVFEINISQEEKQIK